jgi:hypothetical protein
LRSKEKPAVAGFRQGTTSVSGTACKVVGKAIGKVRAQRC